MPNQARVQIGVSIQSGNLQYQNVPNAFNAVVAGANGPTPGVILCALDPGTDISFAQLTAFGGFCVLTNLDPTNYVTVGVYDTGAAKFYPLMDVLAGEFYALRLSQHLGKEYPGTGTGAGSTSLRIKAYGAPVRVKVEAFDP